MKYRFLLIPLVFASTAFSFEAKDILFQRQWGIKNTGQTIFKNISDLEREKIQGVPGLDINWLDTTGIESLKKELIVAVIDSGLDINHPDLKGRVWYNETLCKNAANAKNLPCNGFNFLDNNNNIADDVGHGTHVAGVIAANKNNIGIFGAADSRIKIMPLKVINSSVNGFTYNGKLITDVVADAMNFAIKNGAEVINLSLGWPKLIDTPKIRQAFKLAEEKNIFIVAASGNNTKDLPTFPCSYETVVCVGAVNNRGELTDFTNFGSKVDLVAPGEYIVSTYPSNLESRTLRIKNYEVKRGSSQAAPFVTSAIATLKLVKPYLSNDDVRQRLFSSTRELGFKDKFVKFGFLDFAKLINEDEGQVKVIPELKDITEVKFNSQDGQFSFKLNLKNISSATENVQVCLKSMSAAIEVEQECFLDLAIAAHSKNEIQIKGKILDFNEDSHVLFKILLNKKEYLASIVFSRDLNNEKSFQVAKVKGGSFEDMAFITPDRKLSRMTKVIDKFKESDFPEYYYLEKNKLSDPNTVISLLSNLNGDYEVRYITIPKVNKLISIHRKDINLDGKLDYFIYTLSASKNALQFFVFDQNLNPLFGKDSKWTMDLSTFEGLPIDNNTEKFEWLRINNPILGNILVPSIYRNYSMPELDNSTNILDRDLANNYHQYYFNLIKNKIDDSIKVELRVIDSVSLMKKMRKDFKLYDYQQFSLLKPLPQNKSDVDSGVIHSLGMIFDGTKTKFLDLTLSYNDMKFVLLNEVLGLDTALVYPLINLDSMDLNFKLTLTQLINRGSAEFLTKDSSVISRPYIFTTSWDNPIIGLLSAYTKDNLNSYLVENRSTIAYVDEHDLKSEIPIYRDSSFPGQNFSETLFPMVVDSNPAVFVNSTLIYGERLYTATIEQNELKRPLKLSINLPLGCVPLTPERIKESLDYQYLFLCKESSNEIVMKMLPITLK